jgi:dTMP kinase
MKGSRDLMLIALEGIDGSGKGTQANVLADRLKTEGREVTVLQFPRYAETSFGKEVGRYLNGDFGTLEEVHPKFSSLLYALDRYQSLETIHRGLSRDRDVICDRYIGSNIAHQAARVANIEQAEMIRWIREVEENILGIPKPDLVIFLDIDLDQSQKLVGRKQKRSYTNRSHDLHEASREHLERARQIFRKLSTTPGWVRIVCTRPAGVMRPIVDIAEDIYEQVLAARANVSAPPRKLK